MLTRIFVMATNTLLMNTSNVPLEFVNHLTNVIQENLEESNLDNTYLAKRLFLSEAQFYRKVKREFGCSPNVLIRKMRLNKAEKLLSGGQQSVRDVAFNVGFSHVGYFIRKFEEQFGKSPGQMIRNR